MNLFYDLTHFYIELSKFNIFRKYVKLSEVKFPVSITYLYSPIFVTQCGLCVNSQKMHM